jgi:hypothetical protein
MVLRVVDQAGIERMNTKHQFMISGFSHGLQLTREGTHDLMAQQLSDASSKTLITEKMKA